MAATLSPTRFLLALLMRLWQVVGYLHLWVLTLAMLLAMCLLQPQRDAEGERPRIGFPCRWFSTSSCSRTWWRWH